MPEPTKPVLSSNEAKLLYTLIDAAADEGRLRGTRFEPRWLEIRREAEAFPFIDRASLYFFLEDIDADGLLHKTWMRERWLAVKLRVRQHPMDSPPSQAPFPTRDAKPAAR